MMYPIYQVLFGVDYPDVPSLELAEDQIVITYKTYKSDNADDMQAIIDGRLTPGIMTRKLTLSVRHFQLPIC